MYGRRILHFLVLHIVVLHLQSQTLKQIFEHAQAEYPEECCGIILSGNAVPDQSTEATQQEYVHTCRNIQNQRHADDPGTHPRDARTAYLMDPGDLLRIHKESERENRPIKAFYHSHPDHDSYFSDKDKADATLWDEPVCPDSAYVVLSVYGGEIRDIKAFAWNEQQSDFVPVEILPVSD